MLFGPLVDAPQLGAKAVGMHVPASRPFFGVGVGVDGCDGLQLGPELGVLFGNPQGMALPRSSIGTERVKMSPEGLDLSSPGGSFVGLGFGGRLAHDGCDGWENRSSLMGSTGCRLR